VIDYDVAGGTNNKIINNTLEGVTFAENTLTIETSSNYNLIENNTITGDVSIYRADYNNFTNNIIENCTSDCLHIISGDHNIFDGGTISNAVTNLIKISEASSYGDSEYNEFRNLVLTNSTNYDIELLEDSNYITFTNVTFNESRVNIPDGKMIVKWYLDAQVNNSITKNPIDNVNVSGGFSYLSYDSTFSTLTDANGDIAQQEYTAYRNWDGTITHYNISFVKNSYETNSTNYTGNLDLNVLLVPDTEDPSATLNTPINNSNVTNVDTNFTVNLTDNLGIKNATLYIYNSSDDLYNQTSVSFVEGITIKALGIVVSLVDGIYEWFYSVWDWADNSDTTGNYTVTQAMVIEIVTPTPTQIFTEDNPTTYFNITTTSDADECYWSPDTGETNYTMTEVNTTWFTLSNTSMVDGPHTISFWCNDTSNNWYESDTVSFDVDSVNVTVCRDLTVSRTYYLQNDLYNAGTCIRILNSSISFDGGFNEISSDYSFSGTEYCISVEIISGGEDVDITNTKFLNCSTAIVGFLYADGLNISNSIFNNSRLYHIRIDDVVNGTFNNLSFYNGGDGFSVEDTSRNNIFSNLLYDGGGEAFSFSYGGYNNIIKNSNLTTSGSYIISSQYDSEFPTEVGYNNTFINCSYDSTKEGIETNNNLTRKWYFSTQVNDSNGNPIQGAYVTFYDKDGNLLDYIGSNPKQTDENGRIPRQEIIEYINNGGTKTYETPHTINVSASGYITNSTTYNLTTETNINHFVLLSVSEYAPTTVLKSPVDYYNSSSYLNNMICNSTDVDGNLKNITIYSWIGGLLESAITKNITGSANSTIFPNFGFTSEGTYEWNCYVCDDVDNCVFAPNNYTINIDVTDPTAILNSPENNSNSTNPTQNFTANLTDNIGLKNATLYLYNQTGLVNSTVVNFAIGVTSKALGIVVTVVDEIYTWFYKVFDWSENSATTGNFTTTIDSTKPIVTITNPLNSQAYNYANHSINFTVTDNLIGIDSCWYTNDTGVTNYTLNNCGNFTQNLSEGSFTYTIYANDTLNNIGSDTVTFQISLGAPAITLNAPLDKVYIRNGTDIYFNYTAIDVDNLGTCQLWGNWTGVWEINYTWVSPESTKMNWTTVNITQGEGNYKWNIWCNDSVDNGGFSLSNFTFTLDETNPKVVNSHYTPTTVYVDKDVNIYGNISDTNLDTVWIDINYTGNYQNITITTKVGDTYNYTLSNVDIDNFENISWRWWANDSANNVNHSVLKSFNVINRNPYNVTIINPPNETYTNNNYIIINFTAIDLDLDTLNYSLYNSTDGINFSLYGSTTDNNITFSGFDTTEGLTHYYYITANDTILQNTSEIKVFSIDKLTPNLTIDYPLESPSIQCSLINIDLNYTVQDANIDYCEFNVTGLGLLTTPNTRIEDCSNVTFNNSMDNAVQQLRFRVVDKAGNSNSTLRLIYFKTSDLHYLLNRLPTISKIYSQNYLYLH